MNFDDYINHVPYATRTSNPEQNKRYYDEENRLRAKFYADVKEDLGITDNPKADLLLEKAWDSGHSSGYSDVYNVALDLVDLIDNPKYVVNRAHPDSPAGVQFADRAIAVDTHGCLVFICENTTRFSPVAIPRAHDDMRFDELYKKLP